MISSTVSPIQSPYSRREAGGSTAQHSGDDCAATPVDLAEVSVPRESDGAAWLSWKKAGAALLLAAPIVAGAVTDAHAAMVLPPTDPYMSCTPVEGWPSVWSCKYTGPLSESDVSIMKSLAAPTATDNKTALKVRESYGKLADTVQKHDHEFKVSLGNLQREEDLLKSFPGNRTHHDFTVVVEKGEDVGEKDAAESWTKTTLKTGKSTSTLVERAGLRKTTVMGPDQHISLLETDAVREIDDGNVKRSWFLKDVDGHSAGDFDVVVRHADHATQHLVVHGASITNQTSERYSGFAGNIDVHTVDSFQVLDPSAQTYPDVQFQETSYSFSESAPTKGVHYTAAHEVEVRQDGSTLVRDGEGPWVEGPAAAPAVK